MTGDRRSCDRRAAAPFYRKLVWCFAISEAVSTDFKGKVSPVLYVGGIMTAWTLSA